MPIRKINFTIGEYYHIYNRGSNKDKIFHDKNDYERFVDLLIASNRKEKFNFADSIKGISVYELLNENPIVAIGAYTLMPNHFHILVTPLVKNGITIFMHKLGIAYATYFNQKYKRTGVLFEGRFKAKYINDDRYLKYIFSYIHLNVKTIGIDHTLYPYSSYLDYYGKIRKQNLILDKTNFPQYFSTKKDFIKEINDWVNYRDSLDPV